MPNVVELVEILCKTGLIPNHQIFVSLFLFPLKFAIAQDLMVHQVRAANEA